MYVDTWLDRVHTFTKKLYLIEKLSFRLLERTQVISIKFLSMLFPIYKYTPTSLFLCLRVKSVWGKRRQKCETSQGIVGGAGKWDSADGKEPELWLECHHGEGEREKQAWPRRMGEGRDSERERKKERESVREIGCRERNEGRDVG